MLRFLARTLYAKAGDWRELDAEAGRLVMEPGGAFDRGLDARLRGLRQSIEASGENHEARLSAIDGLLQAHMLVEKNRREYMTEFYDEAGNWRPFGKDGQYFGYIRRRDPSAAKGGASGSNAQSAVAPKGGAAPSTLGQRGATLFKMHISNAISGSNAYLMEEVYERVLLRKHGLIRRMDFHLVDPRSNRQLVIRYEVKTNTGRKTLNQLNSDALIRAGGDPVHDVHVDLKTSTITVDGSSLQSHLRYIRKRLAVN